MRIAELLLHSSSAATSDYENRSVTAHFLIRSNAPVRELQHYIPFSHTPQPQTMRIAVSLLHSSYATSTDDEARGDMFRALIRTAAGARLYCSLTHVDERTRGIRTLLIARSFFFPSFSLNRPEIIKNIAQKRKIEQGGVESRCFFHLETV